MFSFRALSDHSCHFANTANSNDCNRLVLFIITLRVHKQAKEVMWTVLLKYITHYKHPSKTHFELLHFDTPISVSGSGRREKVTLWIPMIQRSGLAYKLRPKCLPIETLGCMNLMAVIDYNWCIPETKNKLTEMLNSPPDIYIKYKKLTQQNGKVRILVSKILVQELPDSKLSLFCAQASGF